MVNTFFTDKNPVSSAKNLNYPKLQGKMIIETSQMLAVSLLEQNHYSPIQQFNPKHQSSLWINLSKSNFKWGLLHLEALLDIYDIKYEQPNNYSNSRQLLVICKYLFYELKFKYEELTLPHLAFTKGNEDLKEKYGSSNGTFYVANSFSDAEIAYKEYLSRKSYWQKSYRWFGSTANL
jgi:hypothetical protein